MQRQLQRARKKGEREPRRGKEKGGETNEPRVSIRRRNTNIRQTRATMSVKKRDERVAMMSVAPASRYIDIITLIHARTSLLKRAFVVKPIFSLRGNHRKAERENEQNRWNGLITAAVFNSVVDVSN